jgi:rubrerythrin
MGVENAVNMEGGIRAWHGRTAYGPQELNLNLLRGDETTVEVLRVAYGLETGLTFFYRTLSEQSSDAELRSLFQDLAQIEKHHQDSLFQLYQELSTSAVTRDAFQSNVTTELMEGGFDVHAFMQENEAHLQTVPDVLQMAMMVETQALDLYLRFSHRSTDTRTKDVLRKIADEEKTHLTALGRLIGDKV